MAHRKRGTDRRIQKTREALQQALVGLLLERRYEDIAVQTILDRANVGRSTFYSHFSNKDDLLESGFEDLLAHLRSAQATTLVAAGKEPKRILAFSLPVFEHAQGHRQVYQATLGSSAGEILRRSMERVVAQLIVDGLARVRRRPGTGGSRIPTELSVRCLAATFMSVLFWWLDQEDPPVPRQADEHFRAVALPMLEAMLSG